MGKAKLTGYSPANRLGLGLEIQDRFAIFCFLKERHDVHENDQAYHCSTCIRFRTSKYLLLLHAGHGKHNLHSEFRTDYQQQTEDELGMHKHNHPCSDSVLAQQSGTIMKTAFWDAWLSGIIKIALHVAVAVWYCRILHAGLTAFRWECFFYKCPVVQLVLDLQCDAWQ